MQQATSVGLLVFMIVLLLLAGCVTAVDEALPYESLPEVTLATPVRLVASPNHPTAYLSNTDIPSDTRVQLIGSDPDAAWLLVRHESILGWMPTIFSRTNVATLASAFTVDPVPSECVYLGTLLGLDETWTSSLAGDAIVVGNLSRPSISDAFEEAVLHLTIDGRGQAVEADYVHTALTGESAVVLFGFSVAGLAKDSTLGFALTDAGEEPVDFAASIFSAACREERYAAQLPVGKAKTVATQVSRVATESPSETAVQEPIVVTDGQSRPTPMPAGTLAQEPAGEVRPLGALWETNGVAMNLIWLEIRSGSDRQDAALRAEFRLFNNTGQRLLVDIDWNSIFCEDSIGTRYVDWDGGGITSTWVEPDGVFSFDRYYTIEPGKRSRVPASSEYVACTVTTFSRINNARWQFDINPTFVPLTLDDFGEVKGIGEYWENNGLRLTVTGIDVRAASDREDAAAYAWFEVENLSNDRVLVEMDLGRIYLVDSFGRRFNDWDGGGAWSFALDPGKSRSFDRYYTEMAGQRSRVTRGSEFVVIQAFDVGRITRAAWHMPIIR